MAYYVKEQFIGYNPIPNSADYYNSQRNFIISTVGSSPVKGTVFAQAGTVEVDWDDFIDFRDSIPDDNNDPLIIFNYLGVPYYYVLTYDSSGNASGEYFSQPLHSSKYPSYSWSLHSTVKSDGSVTAGYWSLANRISGTAYLVASYSQLKSGRVYFNYQWTNEAMTAYGPAGSGETSTPTYQEVDISEPPIDAKPLPSVGNLAAPSSVAFGLRLTYAENIEVDDYNVTVSSDRFGDSIKPLNSNNSEVKISEGVTGKLTVTISSRTWDGIEVTATYTIVELGPYQPGGEPQPGGGNGSFDDGESDDIFGSLPNGTTENDTSANGLYTRYVVNSSVLREIGNTLWADTIGDLIEKTLAELLFGSLSDAVISLVSYPFNLSRIGGGSQQVKIGPLLTKASAPVVGSSGFRHDWGSILVGTSPTHFDNFIDYTGQTKISLYLPWGPGFIDLDPAEVNGKNLSVSTNFEFSKGTCVHTVAVGNLVIGSYSGVCGKQIPVSSGSPAMGPAVVAAAGVALGVGASMAAGAAAEAAANAPIQYSYSTLSSGKRIGLMYDHANDAAMSSLRSSAPRVARGAVRAGRAVSSLPAYMSRSGSFQEGNAGLSIQQPFIVYSRPDMVVDPLYGHLCGYPSIKGGTISSAGDGQYFEVSEVHLSGVPCTDVEGAEIDAILKGGAIW